MQSASNPLADERQCLEKVYHTYTVDESLQTKSMRELIVRTFTPYLRGGHGLELGCSDGYMTQMIAAKIDRLDVVEGSKTFLGEASKRKRANVRFFDSPFEEFN